MDHSTTENEVQDAMRASGRVGLGVDLVEIARMRKIISRTPRFRSRYFTEAERAYCDERADPAKAYAVRFAAKEAAAKALGTGFSNGISPMEIEVLRGDGGKPSILLSGNAKERFDELGMAELALSLSHSDSDAVACVVAICDGADARHALKADPAAELADRFKKARAFLDEI